MNGFFFGSRSLKELEGVHPQLILLCGVALWQSEQDFSVFDGARTREEQEEYIRRGVSWTLESKHLLQKDGYAHAIDLVPWINGKNRWDSIAAFQEIGRAMRLAALRYRITIVWGANQEHGGDWRGKNDMAHFELRGI
jgi:peptidoglycan L-alanyl-D-glutamate endopeptidase CwlK